MQRTECPARSDSVAAGEQGDRSGPPATECSDCPPLGDCVAADDFVAASRAHELVHRRIPPWRREFGTPDQSVTAWRWDGLVEVIPPPVGAFTQRAVPRWNVGWGSGGWTRQ